MIRRADAADLPRIIELGRKNHEAVNASPYDPDAARAFVAHVIEAGAVFLSDGGMIGGLVSPFWAAPLDLQAWEMFWFAEDGSGLALLAAFRDWAHAQGAVVRFTTKRESRAFERLGFTPREIIYGDANVH